MIQETKLTLTELKKEVSCLDVIYTGTEHYYKIPFSDCVYTDGIKSFQELLKCNWLISDLGIEIQHNKEIQKYPFLLCKIEVDKDNKAIITLREDTNEEPIFKRVYDYTDFKLKEYEFYIIDKVFLLKSEY